MEIIFGILAIVVGIIAICFSLIQFDWDEEAIPFVIIGVGLIGTGIGLLFSWPVVGYVILWLFIAFVVFFMLIPVSMGYAAGGDYFTIYSLLFLILGLGSLVSCCILVLPFITA